MRRIAVVGAVAHPSLQTVTDYVRSLPQDAVIITGGARGVDTAADLAAIERGMHRVRWFPETLPGYATSFSDLWDRLEQRDLLLFRNTLISLDCTEMTVFPEGSTGGSWDAARQARRFGRPVELRYCNGKVYEYLGGFAKKLKSQPQKSLFDG